MSFCYGKDLGNLRVALITSDLLLFQACFVIFLQ